MDKPNISPLQILDISLVECYFQKKSSNLRLTEVPIDSLYLDVEARKLDESSMQSIFSIGIFKDNDEDVDFVLRFTFEILSRSNDSELEKELETFAQIGAPLNALVQARDLIMSLTARAFSKPLYFPMLDIREFAKKISVLSHSLDDTMETEEKPQAPEISNLASNVEDPSTPKG